MGPLPEPAGATGASATTLYRAPLACYVSTGGWHWQPLQGVLAFILAFYYLFFFKVGR